MRQVVEIATQMLQARTTWLKVREDQLSASASASASGTSSDRSTSSDRNSGRPPRVVAERYSEGVMDALAWVLQVDLAHIQAPKLGGAAEPPEHVLVTAVPAYNGYLVEMPANPEPGWQTEYFAYFISERQLLELARALVDLLPGSGSGSGSRSSPGASTADAVVPDPNVDAEAEPAEDESAAVNDRERERDRDPVLLFRQHTRPPRIIRQRPAAADADTGALPGWGTQAWNDGTADGGTSDAGA